MTGPHPPITFVLCLECILIDVGWVRDGLICTRLLNFLHRLISVSGNPLRSDSLGGSSLRNALTSWNAVADRGVFLNRHSLDSWNNLRHLSHGQEVNVD